MTDKPTVFIAAAVLAAAHLLSVAFGAAGLSAVFRDNPYSKFVYLYQSLTAADSGFGFFAPAVSSEIRPVLSYYDGEKWHQLPAFKSNSNEVTLRLGTFNGQVANDKDTDLVAASWAAWCFESIPSSLVVIVEFQHFHLPPMRKFVQSQAFWQPLKRFSFTRPDRVNSYYEHSLE